jgi:hypothetical protein
MLYITLLDQFHPGIYSSQVIDVCDYLNKKHHAKIRLVAFLSIKELLRTDAKKKMKQLSPNALILPAFPGLKNFELTAILLLFVCLFTGERVAICRNVFCAKMALRVKKIGLLKKVVVDGRSALTSEIVEYDVFPVNYLRNNINRIESYVINNSDFRIAVSNQLVKYWEQNFNYVKGKEVVIPCTLDNKFFCDDTFNLSERTETIKSELGIKPNDVVFVYAGSAAPWQSFELMDKILSPLVEKDERIKILFLSKENKDNTYFKQKYPNRVFIKWLEHKDVLSYLHCCDYGLLLREHSDTNKVASPVKFAEYLYAGLPVLITKNLGDFSKYVVENDCGFIVKEEYTDWSLLKKIDVRTKEKCFLLSKKDFMKESEINDKSYKKLLNFLK